jgi:S1-C subfamily serine protease
MSPRPRPSILAPVLIAATAFVAAVFGALVPGRSGDSSAGAPTQTPGDPSAASEHAVQVALPSVVPIESTGKLGSGIVFDGDGDIVTDAHVVSGARTSPTTSPSSAPPIPAWSGRGSPTRRG